MWERSEEAGKKGTRKGSTRERSKGEETNETKEAK